MAAFLIALVPPKEISNHPESIPLHNDRQTLPLTPHQGQEKNKAGNPGLASSKITPIEAEPGYLP